MEETIKEVKKQEDIKQSTPPKTHIKINIKKLIPWIILIITVTSLVIWYFYTKRVTTEEQTTYDSKITQAQTYTNTKEYAKAIKTYYEATEIVPTNIEAYKGIINILLLKNRIEEAQEIVEQSTTQLSISEQSELYILLGNYYYNIKNYDKAKEMYTSAMGIGVNNMTTDLLLAKTLLKLGKTNDAKKELELEGYKDKELSEAKLLLAYIYATEDTTKALETITSIEPAEGFTVQYEELKTVLESLTDDTKYNATKLARIYINREYPYLAITILEPYTEEILEYQNGLYFLGRAYLETGQYQKSIETLANAQLLEGNETDIMWTKARAYLLNNDLDSSLKTYANAIEYAGDKLTKDLLGEYIQTLIKNKQYSLATTSISNILTTLQKPFIYLLGIEANYATTETAKAQYYIEVLDGLELEETEKKEYLYWKIKLQIEGENYANIDTLLSELLSIDEYNPQYYLLSGMYKLTQDKQEEAKADLEKAIEYDLNNSVTEEAVKLLNT